MDNRVSPRAEASEGTGARWSGRRLPGWLGRRVPPAGTPGLDFDALALELAQGVSRRQILRRLVGALATGLAAPLLGRLLVAPATAATTATAAGPCSSSTAGACLNQAQSVLADAL